MTPNELYRLRTAREWIPRLSSQHAPAFVLVTLEQLVDDAMGRLARPTIVFKPIDRTYGAERWLIGRADERPKSYQCNLLGLSAAWLAIGDRGRTTAVRAADLAAPWAKQPSTVVRKAIREDAATWVERTTGCKELVVAMFAIEVGRTLLYTPPAGAAIFDTDIDSGYA